MITETVKNYLIQAGLALALVVVTALTTLGIANKVRTGSFFGMNQVTEQQQSEQTNSN